MPDVLAFLGQVDPAVDGRRQVVGGLLEQVAAPREGQVPVDEQRSAGPRLLQPAVDERGFATVVDLVRVDGAAARVDDVLVPRRVVASQTPTRHFNGTDVKSQTTKKLNIIYSCLLYTSDAADE